MVLRILIFLTFIIVTAPVNEAADRSLADTVKKIFATPTPTPHKKKSSHHPAKKSPTPTPQAPTPSPSAKHGAPNASLSPEQIKGFENYPANVQKLLVSALELTARNLDYKYGSADPANGGMDCSGFVYFVLKQNGVEGVPRD